MRNWKRKLFFWTLVVLFFLIAPSIVLYARGFRFDIKRGVFVHGGAINIKSNPQSVDVTLNGELTQAKKLNRINNSYNITGLIPGNYEIEVSADGFNTWEKKIDVHSDVSSEFWNVLLTRKDYPKTSYDAPGIKKFFTSPKNRSIAYNQDLPEGLAVNIFNLSKEANDTSFSFPQWKLADDSRKENIEWSPQEDYLSIPVEKNISSKTSQINGSSELEYAYFIADLQNNTSFNLNDFLGKKDISGVRWDPKEKDFLFFLSEGNLFRANIKDRTINLLLSEVSSFDLSGSRVYCVKTSNNLIFRSSLDGTSDKAQINSSFPGLNGEVILKIVVYDNDQIALLTQNKNLYIYNRGDRDTYFRRIGEKVNEAHFSNDGKKLLFWTDNEISVYFVRDWMVQPIRNENDLLNITRYSTRLENVQWLKDYEHVIFSTGRFVKIVEIDPRDHINSMDFISTALETPFIIYNGYLERLYFTDTFPEDGSSRLNYIIFPEKIPLLGIGG